MACIRWRLAAGPYQKAFSDMARTAENRKRFIEGLIKFIKTYGFDGMDLDWEYPAAGEFTSSTNATSSWQSSDDRGGRPEDFDNFVLLSKDIKQAFGLRYGYSITLPASYWYLQHFDLAKHQPHVDWFNLMSYDLHGVWDAASKWIGPQVAPHTNLTKIDLALDLLWRAGLKPE
jgi:chitinase